jgi:hypothetical protein
MNRFLSVLAVCPLLLCSVAPVVAQAAPDSGPPPILVVQYEVVKPGHAGAMHDRSESAFVRTAKEAKMKEHYLGMASLSGDNRALFFMGYGSFADWEKDQKSIAANATVSRQLDAEFVADGELLSQAGQSVLIYQKEMSYNTGAINVGLARYWEISRWKIKPGHEGDWHEVVKMYSDALQKVDPNASWATYAGMYGDHSGGMYLFFTPMKSLAEVDAHMMNDPKVFEAIGKDGMKKLGEKMAACVDWEQTNLFRVNPKMSYAPEEWIKADPAFWNAK